MTNSLTVTSSNLTNADSILQNEAVPSDNPDQMADLAVFFLSMPDAVGVEEWRPTRPIEILRTGTFTAMNGKNVTISSDDLDQFVDAFHTRAAGQDIPIDIQHERREAAGWLVSVYRQDDKLIAIPRWNDIGRSLIQSQAFKYISSTLDMVRKYLASISLTNYPAVKGLEPIALSGSTIGQIIIQEDHMTNATDAAGVVTQADAGEQPNPGVQPQSAATPAVTQPTQADLSQALRAMLDAELSTFRGQMAEAIASLQTERSQAMTAMLSELREERDIAEFAQSVTSVGNHALPMKADDVRSLLMDLPVAHRGRVRQMLAQIAETGTVDFGETGTSQGHNQPAKRRHLDAPTMAMLSQFIADGGKVEEFFTANTDVLGQMAEYDLTAFGGNNG